MAYDSARKQVILFGGKSTNIHYHSDTWAWNGKTWSLLLQKSGPYPRGWHSMAYDAARQKIVMFGGDNYNYGRRFGDTWSWDGKTWAQQGPALSPSPRSDHSMVYDAARKQVVLFGGHSGNSPFSDTWTWNGKTWIRQGPRSSPPARHSHSNAYDAARQEMLLFGGFGKVGAGYGNLSDTWTYGALRLQGTFTAYGSGCGTPSVVTLAATANNYPTVGKVFVTSTTNLPSNSMVGVMLIGSSKTFMGPFPLPLSLAPFYMPGCNLLNSMDVLDPFLVASGNGTHSIPIPALPGLVTAKIYMQTIGHAPTANIGKWLTSNGGEVLIGNW